MSMKSATKNTRLPKVWTNWFSTKEALFSLAEIPGAVAWKHLLFNPHAPAEFHRTLRKSTWLMRFMTASIIGTLLFVLYSASIYSGDMGSSGPLLLAGVTMSAAAMVRKRVKANLLPHLQHISEQDRNTLQDVRKDATPEQYAQVQELIWARATIEHRTGIFQPFRDFPHVSEYARTKGTDYKELTKRLVDTLDGLDVAPWKKVHLKNFYAYTLSSLKEY